MYRARAHAGERIIERESEKERGCPLRSSLQNADKERARAAGTPPVRKGVLSSKFVYAELRTNVYIARWWQGREEGHTYIHTHKRTPIVAGSSICQNRNGSSRRAARAARAPHGAQRLPIARAPRLFSLSSWGPPACLALAHESCSFPVRGDTFMRAAACFFRASVCVCVHSRWLTIVSRERAPLSPDS